MQVQRGLTSLTMQLLGGLILCVGWRVCLSAISLSCSSGQAYTTSCHLSYSWPQIYVHYISYLQATEDWSTEEKKTSFTDIFIEAGAFAVKGISFIVQLKKVLSQLSGFQYFCNYSIISKYPNPLHCNLWTGIQSSLCSACL